MSENDRKSLKLTKIDTNRDLKGCNGTLRLQCPCGYKAFVNMSGGSNEGQTFDELVTQNIVTNNLKVNEMGKFFTGINMSAVNFNGQVSGINLEHSRMSNMRNELYIDIIKKKDELEDAMLKKVLEQNDIPKFSYDAYYSDRYEC